MALSISEDGNTCEISGTPVSTQEATTYAVTASNSIGSSTATIDISISDATAAFVTIWETDLPGASNDDQITIGTNPEFDYNYTVNWGDGSLDTQVDGDITHTYTSAGKYTVRITGDFPQIYFDATEQTHDPEKLLSVENWGNQPWLSMKRAFAGCKNMSINTLLPPNLAQVTDMSEMFKGASTMNSDLDTWDVSSVTNMNSMFKDASAFNGDIALWNVSSATDMSSMFEGATAFNMPLIWNVSSVTDMSAMFKDASSFNRNLIWTTSSVMDMSSMFENAVEFNVDLSWNTSSVTDMNSMFKGASKFDSLLLFNTFSVTDMSSMFEDAIAFDMPLVFSVSKVTDMNSMFKGASKFNQLLNWDVSSVIDMSNMFENAIEYDTDLIWTVSSVTDMNAMFKGASNFNKFLNWNVSSVTDMSNMFENASAFNQPLSLWDVTSVSDMSQMLNGTAISTTNYDAILITWATRNLQRDINLGSVPAQYSPSAQMARNTLTFGFNWTIDDLGPANQ